MHETDALPTVARKCLFSGVYKHLCVCVCTCVWAVCVCVYMCTACGGPMLMLGDFTWLLFTLFIKAKSFIWTYSFPILASVASHLASVILYLTFPKSWKLQVGHHTHFHGLGVKTPALTLVPTSALLAELFIQLKFCFLLDPESYSSPGWPGTRSVGQGWLQIHDDPPTSDSQDAVYGFEPSCLATFKFFIVVKT